MRALIAALVLFAFPATAAVIPASPADIAAVVTSAKPGDTITATGAFDTITLTKRADLTLDLKAATFKRLAIVNSSAVAVVGGTSVSSAVKEQVLVQGSSGVSFDGVRLQAEGKAYGWRLVDSAAVKITNFRIDSAFQGINAGRVKGLTVSVGSITGAYNDSIVVVSNAGVLIEYVDIGGNNRVDTRHPDGLQFLCKDGIRNTDVEVHHITVAGATQGIFGTCVTGGYFHDNAVMIDHGNGLAIADCIECRIENNRIATLPGSPVRASINSFVGAARCGNTVMPAAWLRKPGVADLACK